MANRSVKVVLTLDAAQYRTALQSAGRDTQTLASRTDRAGVSMKNLFKVASVSTAALGITRLVEGAVSLEAAYSKTMAQVAVATGAPKSALKDLDALALKLGRDTVFSAQDAAEAMLDLAKGGLSVAQIKAGALRDTLTLASAGGLELGDAAKAVVNSLGAFHLSATETSAAVAALAGAANASSADVSDITQALSQTGTSAHSAGLSIQQTTAFLAEFANSGIKGSDAGTSLRTMLTRLVPQTKQASDAMKALGLTYVDSNGKLVSASQIADRTQKAFKNLSDEDRIRATNLIFGNDAQRAVNVITEQGSKGLAKYVKQTSDLTQAQKLAKAANSGTSGSLEQLKGTIETAEIQIGKGLAPTVRNLADNINELVQDGDFETWASNSGQAVGDFLHEMEPLAKSATELAISTLPTLASAAGDVVDVLELGAKVITPLVDGFNKLPDSAQKALILAGGAKVLSSRMSGLPGLAGASGRGLLIFGSNAKTAGADVEEAGAKAKTAGSRFSTLGATLKGNAVLIAALYAVPKGADLVHQIMGEIGNHAPDVDKLTESLGRLGQASDQTGKLLDQSIGKTDVGRFADKFGINLDRLKKSLETGNIETGYYADTLASLRQQFVDTARDGHIDLDLGNTVDALGDLGTAYDKAHTKAIRMSDDMNDLAIDTLFPGANVRSLAARLKALPDKVETKVLTPGAIKSTADVVKLARQYKLTPDQVKTVMEAKDFASADVKKVLALYSKTEKKRTAKVQADTKQALSDLGRLNRALAQFKSKTIHLDTITNRITSSHGHTTSNTIRGDNGRTGSGSAHGGRVPAGYARGGRVPGTPPANPWKDNVLAMGLGGKPMMVRSGEWIINGQASNKNDAWLKAVNNGLDLNQAFRAREVAGHSGSGGGGSKVLSVDVSGLRVAHDGKTLAPVLQGMIDVAISQNNDYQGQRR